MINTNAKYILFMFEASKMKIAIDSILIPNNVRDKNNNENLPKRNLNA